MLYKIFPCAGNAGVLHRLRDTGRGRELYTPGGTSPGQVLLNSDGEVNII